MHVVGHIHHGPNWIPGRPATHQGEAMVHHLRYMLDHYEAGRLILGGPLNSPDDGIAVFVVADMNEAQEIAAGDPAVRAGVVDYELTELRTVFDAATDLCRFDELSKLMIGMSAS